MLAVLLPHVRSAVSGSSGEVLIVVLGGILSTGAIAALTSMIRTIRGVARDVREATEALVGARPSPMNPNPAKGLIEVVRQHDRQLNSQGRTLSVLLTGTKVLIDQRERPRDDNGHDLTYQDALRRITEEQQRVARESASEG